MNRLTQKLNVLRAEGVAVEEESQVNEVLGQGVGERVVALARPSEASKFRLHVKEVGHITSLLLGLSGRLARAENALLGLPLDHVDRVRVYLTCFRFTRLIIRVCRHCKNLM